LIVLVDLVLRQNRACLKVGSQVHATQFALERRDPYHAGMKVAFADSAPSELALKGRFFREDHVAQALRLARHTVKQSLHRLDLVGAKVQPAVSYRIEHVAGSWVTVEFGSSGKTHPAPFA
jgi:hypothetical protein